MSWRRSEATASSGDRTPSVAVVQPADKREGDDLSLRLRRPLHWTPSGCVLPKREMRAIVVVVGQQSMKMVLMKDDGVIEELPPHGSDPAFDHSVLPGTARRRPHGIDLESPEEVEDRAVEEPITVEDQVARCRLEREGLSELLVDPVGGRGGGHCEVDDATSVVMYEDEDVKDPER